MIKRGNYKKNGYDCLKKCGNKVCFENSECRSCSHKGYKHTEEQKKKISLSNKNKFVSEETRQKQSKALKGKSYDEIHGKKKAKEIRAKLSLAKKGKTVEELGHIPAICDCIACQSARGEYIHLINCYCITCQTKRGEITGKNHPRYINGLSKWPYPIEFDIHLKELIRKRDSFICQSCGLRELDHLINYKQTLHVHHINYIKECLELYNLITLCISCNVRANNDRDYWYAYYTYIMDNYITKGKKWILN